MVGHSSKDFEIIENCEVNACVSGQKEGTKQHKQDNIDDRIDSLNFGKNLSDVDKQKFCRILKQKAAAVMVR